MVFGQPLAKRNGVGNQLVQAGRGHGLDASRAGQTPLLLRADLLLVPLVRDVWL